MKINRLEYTKKLYPHFYDKNDYSNFTKHLKVVGNPQYDIRHKLKTIEWSRILEKPIQLWKEQSEPYIYDMHFKVSVPYIKEINIYKNPIINEDEEVIGWEHIDNDDELGRLIHQTYDEDNVNYFEKIITEQTQPIIWESEVKLPILWDEVVYDDKYEIFKAEADINTIDGTIISPIYYNFKINHHQQIYPLYRYITVIEFTGANGEVVGNTFSEGGYEQRLSEEVEIEFTDNKIINIKSWDAILEFSEPTQIVNIEVRFKRRNWSQFYPQPPNPNIFISDSSITYTKQNKKQDLIPNDTYVLEVKTWDDYHFLKGYPENDYTVKEDNVLQYRYNETFLYINIEEISYSKYLTFRVHKDKIKNILINKNDKPYFSQEFEYDRIIKSYSTSFSYTYFDEDLTNENTYNKDGFVYYYEIEDENANNVKEYFVGSTDEYVYRLPLTDDDFENGVLKDIYDIQVETFDKRYHCRQEYDKVYSKRYCGYDEQLNDCFDHDYSLDMIGRLLNIHRFRFYQVYREDEKYYSRTYPTYYNRATEDDYHYMKRIQFYISNYNHIVFPVLEFWKYYHTMATIRSRKRIIGEMDSTYLRTDYKSDCLDDDGNLLIEAEDILEEEFDTETITEYSINKATLTKGDANYISLGDGWYESTIVNNVYVVPNVEYRLRYGVSEDNEDVTIRLICYNRKGIELRTTPIIPTPTNKSSTEYSISDEYSYMDTLISIPSDTVSVKVVLESNNLFSFSDVTFERMTVINFDNAYMGTDEDYNSNVYELYTIYEDLPTNLRIGGDRFNILFNRSLPLTKTGVFLIDINEKKTTHIELSTSTSLYVSNILESEYRDKEINSTTDYDKDVTDLILPNNEYSISFNVLSENITPTYENNLPVTNDDDFVITTITYYDSSDNIIVGEDIINPNEMKDKIYTDTLAHISYNFTTPNDTAKIHINIHSETSASITEIQLSRMNEMTNDEVYLNED